MLSPVRLVTLCAQRDKDHLEDWDKHLSGLKESGRVTHFHFRALQGGDALVLLEEKLARADVCACLLSADFLAEEALMAYVRSVLDRHHGVLLPVLLRPVLLEGSTFAHMRAVPDEPILASPAHVDQRFMQAVESLRRLIDDAPGVAQRLLGTSHGLTVVLINYASSRQWIFDVGPYTSVLELIHQFKQAVQKEDWTDQVVPKPGLGYRIQLYTNDEATKPIDAGQRLGDLAPRSDRCTLNVGWEIHFRGGPSSGWR